MAAPDEFLIIEPKNWVIGVEEVRVEDDLDTVVVTIEQLNASDLVQDRVRRIVRHIVSRDWRQGVTFQSEDAPFQEDLVLIGEQGVYRRELGSGLSKSLKKEDQITVKII